MIVLHSTPLLLSHVPLFFFTILFTFRFGHVKHLYNLSLLVAADSRVWVGGSDVIHESVWVWAHTQQKFNMTDWKPGQPNNRNGKENCMALVSLRSFQWEDDPCETEYVSLCEREARLARITVFSISI